MKEERKLLKLVIEIVLCFFIAIILVGVVQQFFLAPVGVVGSSMYPTINPEGDKVFVQKRFFSIKRGDVVVFYRPNHEDVTSENPSNSITISDFFNSLPFVNKIPHVKEESSSDNDYTCVIKRVIGIPGDSVEIREDPSNPEFAQLYVNGALVKNDIVMHSKRVRGYGVETGYWTVSDGELFVLGDNRDNSFDSEDYGPIHSDWLMGKVVLARINDSYKFGLKLS